MVRVVPLDLAGLSEAPAGMAGMVSRFDLTFQETEHEALALADSSTEYWVGRR